MVANTSFARAGSKVVLDSISCEDLDFTAIHLNREIDCQLPLRAAQLLVHPFVDTQSVGRSP